MKVAGQLTSGEGDSSRLSGGQLTLRERSHSGSPVVQMTSGEGGHPRLSGGWLTSGEGSYPKLPGDQGYPKDASVRSLDN
jgi:hypothetical protein